MSFWQIAAPREDLRLCTHRDFDRLIGALDGNPLAVDLIARAASHGTDLGDLLGRWQRVRALYLRDMAVNHPLLPLQVSMRVAVECQHMTEASKRLLSILSLLPDGIDAADLDNLFPDEGRSSADLLARTGLALEEQKRWRLMPPVREFAREQLRPDPEDLDRCCAHFIELAGIGQRIGWGTAGDRTIDEMTRLKMEASNIEAIIARKLEGPQLKEGISAALAFGRFQRFSGIGTSETLQLALMAASNAGDIQLQAECHRVLGSMMRMRSQSSEACHHYREADRLYKTLDDASSAILGQAHCYRAFADLERVQGQHPEARDFYGKALPRYKEALAKLVSGSPQYDDARRGYANCIQRLGDLDHLSKRKDDPEASLSAAETRYKEALPIYKDIQDWIGEANCYKGFADVAVARRDLPTGRNQYQNAREKYLASGYKFGVANCTYSLGDVELLDDNLDKSGDSTDGRRPYTKKFRPRTGWPIVFTAWGMSRLLRVNTMTRAAFTRTRSKST